MKFNHDARLDCARIASNISRICGRKHCLCASCFAGVATVGFKIQYLQISSGGKSLGTYWTLEWSIACVCSHVNLK